MLTLETQPAITDLAETTNWMCTAPFLRTVEKPFSFEKAFSTDISTDTVSPINSSHTNKQKKF